MVERRPRAVEAVHTTPIGDELMVHVVGSDETHLLGATTTAVWRRCDGTTPLSALEDVFADQPSELRPELVRLAIDQLEKVRLVEGADNSTDLQRESRRRFLKRAAIAAAVVPTITTVVTAQPAAASSHGCNTTGCVSPLICDTSSGVCVQCTDTAGCNFDTQYCNNGVCADQLASGPTSFCTDNEQCLSDICETTCRNDIGGACPSATLIGDQTCKSGTYCRTSDLTCAPKAGEGATCRRNAACISNCCSGGNGNNPGTCLPAGGACRTNP